MTIFWKSPKKISNIWQVFVFWEERFILLKLQGPIMKYWYHLRLCSSCSLHTIAHSKVETFTFDSKTFTQLSTLTFNFLSSQTIFLNLFAVLELRIDKLLEEFIHVVVWVLSNRFIIIVEQKTFLPQVYLLQQIRLQIPWHSLSTSVSMVLPNLTFLL